MTFPNLSHIEWFWYIIAIPTSFYYGWRGYMGTLGTINQLLSQQASQPQQQNQTNLSKNKLILIYCVQQFIAHLLCSLSGFLALYILSETAEIKGTDGSIFVIFLSIYTIAGITDMLPEILPKVKLPGN